MLIYTFIKVNAKFKLQKCTKFAQVSIEPSKLATNSR